MVDSEKPKGRDDEMCTEIGVLSNVSEFILLILKFLTENPQSQITVYDKTDKQWYTLELNTRQQLVVVMRLPNGAVAKKILDLRDNKFLFDPEVLKRAKSQPSWEDQEAQTKAANAFLARSLRATVKGMAEDTRIKALLLDKRHIKPEIATNAKKLAEELTRPERKLIIQVNHREISLEYKIREITNSTSTLKNLVNATNTALERYVAEQKYYYAYSATVTADNFARYLMEELIDELARRLPRSDALKQFKKTIMATRETFFTIRIHSIPTPNKDDRRTINITII